MMASMCRSSTHDLNCARSRSMSARTMARAATVCPAPARRSAIKSPEVSVAGVRVSDSVSTATFSRTKARSGLGIGAL